MCLGHNCFGAVLYPVSAAGWIVRNMFIHRCTPKITTADFVVADVTDAMLDGVIAGGFQYLRFIFNVFGRGAHVGTPSSG